MEHFSSRISSSQLLNGFAVCVFSVYHTTYVVCFGLSLRALVRQFIFTGIIMRHCLILVRF